MLHVLIPHFTKDCFGPDSSPILFFVDPPHFCENSREPVSTVEHYPIPSGGRSGAIASVLRGLGTEKVLGEMPPLTVWEGCTPVLTLFQWYNFNLPSPDNLTSTKPSLEK